MKWKVHAIPDRQTEKMPASDRLALESGVLGYGAQLRWAAHAIGVYRKKLKTQ
jgi:hypothetical protein